MREKTTAKKRDVDTCRRSGILANSFGCDVYTEFWFAFCDGIKQYLRKMCFGGNGQAPNFFRRKEYIPKLFIDRWKIHAILILNLSYYRFSKRICFSIVDASLHRINGQIQTVVLQRCLMERHLISNHRIWMVLSWLPCYATALNSSSLKTYSYFIKVKPVCSLSIILHFLHDLKDFQQFFTFWMQLSVRIYFLSFTFEILDPIHVVLIRNLH